MHKWFQNLKKDDNEKRWINVRGSWGRDDCKGDYFSYQFCTGPALRFSFECAPHKTSFVISPFFFSLYLTIYGLKLAWFNKGTERHDCYKASKEYGLYWFEKTFWFFWGRSPMSSSRSDPWYYSFNFAPLDFLLGKQVVFTEERLKSYSPVEFSFREKVYTMDSIVIEEVFRFRPRIPFSLWKSSWLRMDLKCENPPMRQGKGENSWDCGDDGTFGLSCSYEGPKPWYPDQEKVFEYCCLTYAEHAQESIKRYGRVDSDRKLSPDQSVFKYLGRLKETSDPCVVSSEST